MGKNYPLIIFQYPSYLEISNMQIYHSLSLPSLPTHHKHISTDSKQQFLWKQKNYHKNSKNWDT